MTSTDGMASNSEDAVAAAPPSPTTDGPEHAAHRATGNAGVPDAAAIATGTCARCATTTPQLTPATRVPGMSAAASALWVRPRGKGLCPPCAWMYPSADTRRTPHLVTRLPDSVTAIDPTDLFHTWGLLRRRSGSIPASFARGAPVPPRAQSIHCADAGTSLMNGYESDCPTAVLVDRPSVAGRPVRAVESTRAARPRSRSASASWSRVVSNSSPDDASDFRTLSFSRTSKTSRR